MAKHKRRTWIASESVASDQFDRLWDVIEDLRRARKLTEEEAAEQNGFVRSTWFTYKARGTIPFALLESVAANLGGSVQALVIPRSSDPSATSEATEESTVIDDATRLANLLRDLPPERRQKLINMFEGMIAVERVNASHPSEPVAGERASRDRSR